MGKKVHIGNVGVDSGQVMICDPGYIDSEWIKREFKDRRILEDVKTGKKYQWRVHFDNYDCVLPDLNMTVNQAINKKRLKELPYEDTDEFSYDGICRKTLNDEFGEVGFNGFVNLGVASRTLHGDGVFPVFAELTKDGSVKRLIIEFD